MLINADKFFVVELQKNGYDMDYKKLIEIYRASREDPVCQRRKQRREAENAAMEEFLEQMHREEQSKQVLRSGRRR